MFPNPRSNLANYGPHFLGLGCMPPPWSIMTNPYLLDTLRMFMKIHLPILNLLWFWLEIFKYGTLIMANVAPIKFSSRVCEKSKVRLSLPNSKLMTIVTKIPNFGSVIVPIVNQSSFASKSNFFLQLIGDSIKMKL
jgi:hypothetical protein